MRWAQLQQRFLERPLREQRILWLLLLAIIFLLWDQLLFSPLQSAISQKQSQIGYFAAEHQRTRELLSDEGDAGQQNQAMGVRLQQLLNTSTQLEGELSLLTQDLITPPRMTQVLKEVLQQETGLTLVKLSNLPAVKLTAADNEQAVLYRHSVELILEGGFFDTLHYLQALEALPWTMGWSELSYQVLEYPKARVRLRINTLSTESDWIGA